MKKRGTLLMMVKAGVVGLGVVGFGVSGVWAGDKGAVGDLYVADAFADAIVQIDSATGEVVGNFAVDGVSYPFDAIFGPNGNMFVANLDQDTVTEHDGETGDLIGVYASEKLRGPAGLRFLENGNLLVSNGGTGGILEYDTAGEYVGVFAYAGNGDACPLNIGRDGDVFASNYGQAAVYRFSPDGSEQGIFAAMGSGTAEGNAFGPNGNLYVVNGSENLVMEFDELTGELVGNFITTDLDYPLGIDFGPDGDAWVANYNGGEVDRFDGTTGEWVQSVVGFAAAISVTVKPDPAGDCLQMVVDPLLAGQSATWEVSGATSGEQVTIVWGLIKGLTILGGYADYCATFGIKGVNQNRLVCSKTADGSGGLSCTRKVPSGARRLRILSQAAERGTCPDECVSNLDDQVVD